MIANSESLYRHPILLLSESESSIIRYVAPNGLSLENRQKDKGEGEERAFGKKTKAYFCLRPSAKDHGIT